MADDEIRVLGDDTPVARRGRRLPGERVLTPALCDQWNEMARARPPAIMRQVVAPPFPGRIPPAGPR